MTTTDTAAVPVYLTTKDVAARLAVAERTVLRAIVRGTLPATRLGYHWRIPAAAVDALEAVARHVV